MTNTTPLVSVIMPAYNAEKYIAEAIESILHQTFVNFEFIIIDDASTDGTWKIIQEYAEKDTRIIAKKNTENLKICKTLNKSIDMAIGKYIARMDADDWSYPNRLEKQVRFMEDNSELVISGGFMEVCDPSLKIKNIRSYPLSDEDVRDKMFYYSPFCHPLAIFRASTIKEVKYNEFLSYAQDYDLYFRLGLKGKFGNLSSVLLKYRDFANFRKYRVQDKLALYIRLKAIMEYGYKINSRQKLYWLGQFLSLYSVPSKLKYSAFCFFRGGKNRRGY